MHPSGGGVECLPSDPGSELPKGMESGGKKKLDNEQDGNRTKAETNNTITRTKPAAPPTRY